MISKGNLYIQDTPAHGRGVFTRADLEEGEIIEVCPVIPLNENDLKVLDKTTLYDYYFLWGNQSNRAAIALGFGSIYNHDYHANAHYDMDFDARTITIFALRPIAAEEEICINYNGEPDNEDKVWFDK